MKKNRMLVLLLIMSLMMATFTACGGSGDAAPADEDKTATAQEQALIASDSLGSDASAGMVDKQSRTPGGYNTVTIGGLDFDMPDYFTYAGSDSGSEAYAAETGRGFVVIQTSHYDGTFSEEEFRTQCDDFYSGYVSGLQNSGEMTEIEDAGSGEARTQRSGLQCMMYACNATLTEADVRCEIILALVNNPDSNQIAIVALMQSYESEYDYTAAYGEMIDNCVPAN